MKKPKLYKRKKSPTVKKYKRPGLKTGREKGYDSAWESYRRRFLYYNPKCYICGEKASCVDHIVTIRSNPDLAESTTNHLPNCASCHSIVTGLFDRHAEQNLDGKLAWIKKQREARGVNIKVIVMRGYHEKKRR